MRRWRMARLTLVLLATSLAVQSAFGQWFQMYLDTSIVANSHGAEAFASAFIVPFGYVEGVQMTLTRNGEEVGYGWARGSYAPCGVWISDFGYYPPYTLYDARSEAWGNVPDYGWYWQSGFAFGSTPGPQVSLYLDPAKKQGSTGFVLRSWTPGLNTTELSASGSPPGGSYQWTIGPKLQFDGSSTTENASVKGTSESESPGDTWVQVTYDAYGYTAVASIRFSVLAPRQLEATSLGGGFVTSAVVANGIVRGYITMIKYNVKDQLSPPETIELPGIPATEILATLYASHAVEFIPPDGTPLTAPSDLLGQVTDKLYVLSDAWPPGPPVFSAARSQTMNLDGHVLWPTQVQTYGLYFASISAGVLSW